MAEVEAEKNKAIPAMKPGQRRDVTDKDGVNVLSDGPGRAKPETSKMILDWIGTITFDGNEPLENFVDNEGEGEKVVVLNHYVTGANGIAYKQGDVRHISKFLNGYGDRKQLENVRAAAKRLFDLKAIRLADSEESEQAWVEINPAQETPTYQQERERRMALEQEIKTLREAMSNAQVAQKEASPAGTETGGSQQQSGQPTQTDPNKPNF